MRLIDYTSWNPVGLAIPWNAYDEEFVVASFIAFINNLELIDNGILKNFANQNKAPYQLIKKRAENKRLLVNTSNSQLKSQLSANSSSGPLQTFKPNQFCSKPSQTQSAQTQSSKHSAMKKNSINYVDTTCRVKKMSRKLNVKGFKAGLIPEEKKTLKARGSKETTQWQGSLDRELSLSDPR